MEWENQSRPSAPSTPSSMSSQQSAGSGGQRSEKIPTLKQISPSPSVTALSKLSDEELRRKGIDDLVRILRRVEGDYKSLMSEHGSMVKDVNRRFQIFVLETRSLKEVNQKLQDDNQELRDLCCFLDDDRQRGRKLAREWQRFGRYTASVMRSEVAVYQEKLHELESRQSELIAENMELKELCLYLDQERVGTDRDEGDGSSNGTVTGQEDGLVTMDTTGSITPTPTGPTTLSSSSAVTYIRELEHKVHQLEEEKRLLAQRMAAGGTDLDDMAQEGDSAQDGSMDKSLTGKPEAVVHAMKVLQVHEELEKVPMEEENLDDSEKAIVREMCNVVWRKLGDAGDVGSFNESSDSILDPPSPVKHSFPDSPAGLGQAHSRTVSQPQPQMASTPLSNFDRRKDERFLSDRPHVTSQPQLIHSAPQSTYPSLPPNVPQSLYQGSPNAPQNPYQGLPPNSSGPIRTDKPPDQSANSEVRPYSRTDAPLVPPPVMPRPQAQANPFKPNTAWRSSGHHQSHPNLQGQAHPQGQPHPQGQTHQSNQPYPQSQGQQHQQVRLLDAPGASRHASQQIARRREDTMSSGGLHDRADGGGPTHPLPNEPSYGPPRSMQSNDQSSYGPSRSMPPSNQSYGPSRSTPNIDDPNYGAQAMQRPDQPNYGPPRSMQAIDQSNFRQPRSMSSSDQPPYGPSRPSPNNDQLSYGPPRSVPPNDQANFGPPSYGAGGDQGSSWQAVPRGVPGFKAYPPTNRTSGPNWRKEAKPDHLTPRPDHPGSSSHPPSSHQGIRDPGSHQVIRDPGSHQGIRDPGSHQVSRDHASSNPVSRAAAKRFQEQEWRQTYLDESDTL